MWASFCICCDMYGQLQYRVPYTYLYVYFKECEEDMENEIVGWRVREIEKWG